MEKNKENKSKTKLTDELLEKVNAGSDLNANPLLWCSNCCYVGDKHFPGYVCPNCHKGVLICFSE